MVGNMMAMKRTLGGVLAVAATVSSATPVLVERQATGTSSNPATQSILCGLSRPGSAVVRDTIYIDGGFTLFNVRTGVNDIGEIKHESEFKEIFTVNLTQPWTSGDFNVSQVVKRNKKFDSTFYLPTMDGHMLANDHQLILYGGTMVDTDSITDWPRKDIAMSQDIYAKPPVPLLDPGQWRPIDMKPLHRGVVGGAYTSAPSENLGFVFGGSKTTSGADARGPVPLKENNAAVLSDGLIVVDMTTMKDEIWKNITIPKNVRKRAFGELVWLPVGEKGTLVAIGGTQMTWNETLSVKPFSKEQEEKWKEYGAKLMSTVELYDVKNDKWYLQETTGDVPPPTAHFCTVAATSEDGTIHNIYAYGGTTGLNIGTTYGPRTASGGNIAVDFYDHVYVLSLPAFVWTRLYVGEAENARRGHRCHRVAEDKMMIVGGISNPGGGGVGCVKSFVRLFDMSEGKMLDAYDPAADNKYKVPVAVQTKIQATEKGGSKMVPEEWDDDGTSKLLDTKYPHDIKAWWPYPVVQNIRTEGDAGNTTTIVQEKDSGMPKYLAPLLGTVLGLLALVTVLCIVLFYLKKRKDKIKHLMSDSAATEAVNRRRTWSWLIGTQDEKGRMHDEFGEPFHGTDGTETYDGSTVTGPLSPIQERENPLHGHYQLVNEAPQSEIYEMPVDAIQASELPTQGDDRPSKRVTINEDPYTINPSDRPTSPLSPRTQQL